jgi:uncharacterized repeat protein (TIGR03803 family)
LSGAAALSVQQGSSGKETLSLSSQSLSGTVQLSYRVSEGGAALPSSAFSFSPSSVTLSAGKAVQVPLTVKTPSSLAGHDQVQVTASLSGASASATFPLTVTGEQVIYSFQGGSDGANPEAALVLGSNGDLYGTTELGGASSKGTVFQLSPPASPGSSWTEQVIYSFKGGSDGADPKASLVLGSNGDLYGTTYGLNGTSDYGTIFQLSPPTSSGGSWAEQVLHNFGSTGDGANPRAPLILGSNRELYGTTAYGGTPGNGTVFQLTPTASSGGNWTETVLHSFGSGGDGIYPFSSLIFSSNGELLYGTTAGGGSSGTSSDGTVFELSPITTGSGWAEQVIYNFQGGSDGADPLSSLIFGSKGELYGTTGFGGASDLGTVFQLSPPTSSGGSWTETVLYSFGGGSDGAHPTAALIFGSKGELYGTTAVGGASGKGTVFQLAPATTGSGWTEQVIYNFKGSSDGANPEAPLILGSNGDLYGTTYSVNGTSDYGTVFKIVL